MYEYGDQGVYRHDLYYGTRYRAHAVIDMPWSILLLYKTACRSTFPTMPRFIRSACLTNYVPVARSFGLDPYRLLREAGLDRSGLTDPEIKIPVADVCHLLEHSARSARAEDFGL